MNTLRIGAFSKTVALVALLSVIGNVILTWIGWRVSNPPTTFGPYDYPTVAGLTVAGVIAAGVVYLVMRYWSKADVARINHNFIIISVIALLVSFIPDIMIPWSTDADQVGWTYGIIVNLMLMHVVAAGFVMYYFVRE
ncbi:MAG TPA: hypothetical protein VF803_01625 [Candidatus Paceibacterota bacterium]